MTDAATDADLLDAIPDLEAWLNRTMHASLRAKLSVGDVRQETYLRARANLSSFEKRGEGSFTAWLRTIARNVIRSAIRASTTRTPSGLVDSLVESGILTPSAEMRQNELKKALAFACSELPEHHRAVLTLRYVDGLTFEDIGARLGRTGAAIRGLHRNAVESLREALVVFESDRNGSGV